MHETTEQRFDTTSTRFQRDLRNHFSGKGPLDLTERSTSTGSDCRKGPATESGIRSSTSVFSVEVPLILVSYGPDPQSGH